MERESLRIEGKFVILQEVEPKYFEYIIKWRNNPDNNKFLNQPYELTVELQQKWYDKYLQDDTQGLLILIDKQRNFPFGTMGWTDYANIEKICVTGRLLIGEVYYKGSAFFKEATELFNKYLYSDKGIKIMYSHIGKENIASLKWHKKWGYKICHEFKFPNNKFVNGIEQLEFSRSYDEYKKLFMGEDV